MKNTLNANKKPPFPSSSLLSLTDAARFLGYKTNRPISRMIQSEILPTYVLPDSKRKRVKVSDLMKLIKVVPILDHASSD
tara:strand:+ start:152 stop:391 length:240 start_codon:yes stop_codon:yes gene_type:complete